MTTRAVYAVIEERMGWAQIQVLGDGSAVPVTFDGRDERDALGYRTEQYDELVKVTPDILEREVSRRRELLSRMVWTVHNPATKLLIALYDMNQGGLNDLVAEAIQGVDTYEEQKAVEDIVTWWNDQGDYGLDLDTVNWNDFMAYVKEN